MSRGRFITFEGPEGAGKSTALAAIADALRKEGEVVVATREPGAGAFGIKIREILLHGDEITPEAELFLFLADRSEHMDRIIFPALARGEWVLCDRHSDSTLVYQSVGRGLPLDFIRQANGVATRGTTPDLTLLFDIDAATGLQRVKNKDRMDAQPLAFHERVRAGFLELARNEPLRFRTLDASASPGLVIDQALGFVRSL